MTGKKVDLQFDGYWRVEKKEFIPNCSGIYCVYACTYDSVKKTVSLKRLIYIGESLDVGARLDRHEKQERWEAHLKSGEILCYSMAKVSSEDRVRCEAALIHKTTPPVNTEYTGAFTYNETTVTTSGKNALLPASLTATAA